MTYNRFIYQISYDDKTAAASNHADLWMDFDTGCQSGSTDKAISQISGQNSPSKMKCLTTGSKKLLIAMVLQSLLLITAIY
ncbi:MAG TPA: hypothetical protein VER14_08030 [Phototrophicaceae bacterium]|nr:hypothetical protein [Phototrophicaceae bacterium]